MNTEKRILVNSREFGSTVDINTDSGLAFNPKYFLTAEQSYTAGAKIIHKWVRWASYQNYAGQQIIVPSDQYEQILHIHQAHVEQAQASGQIDQYQALSQITLLRIEWLMQMVLNHYL